tara:strand:+ start:30698 stop:32038 length:1341 start_codon:yes stop_codon:yes gene_type:complete
MKRIYVLIVTFFLFGARGDLLTYNLIDEIDIETAQQVLNAFIPSAPMVEYDLEMYSITYETIDQFGNEAIASGAIVLPVGQIETLPLVSFHHGTQVRRLSTYSSDDASFDLLTSWLGGTGYVSVFPDYLGLGVSELFHPYQINIPSATSIIDILFATKELCLVKDIRLNDQLFLTGYSEGGYVTAAAQKMIEEEYSDEFNIAGSTLCAGAYDMSGTMFDLMVSYQEYGAPYYLPYVVLAYQDTYNLVDDLDEYFLPQYSDTLQVLFNGDYGSGDIDAIMPSIPIEIFIPEVVEEVVANENHPLRVRLRENDLYDWAPQSPTQLIHSYSDELIPYQNSEIAYEYFVNNGSPDVELLLVEFGGHQEAAPIILMGAFYWFQTLKETEAFLKGDVNIDFSINISDIVMIIEFIINDDIPNPSQHYTSDYNSDNIIDIIDVILILNSILSS